MDTSWIDDDEDTMLEKEPMDEIQCYCVYVDADQSITHVSKSSHILEICTKIQNHATDNTEKDQSNRVISREKLLQLIHSNKIRPNFSGDTRNGVTFDVSSGEATKNGSPLPETKTKYRLLEILLYNIDLDTQDLSLISETDHLKIVTTMDEIVIPPSLFVFHEINCLYFIFQEVIQDYQSPKPILKILSDIIPRTNPKKTKKVAFREDLRHTKKIL